MAKNPLPAKAPTRPEGLIHPSGTFHSSLAAPGHREFQTPKAAQKRVAQPRPLGVQDDGRPWSVEGLKKKTTCRSPTTSLLCLQTSPTSALITWVTRQRLARMNTASRGVELLLGL